MDLTLHHRWLTLKSNHAVVLGAYSELSGGGCQAGQQALWPYYLFRNIQQY